MTDSDVIWHEEDEYVVMEEDGWALLLMANHFKYKFWYEVRDPQHHYFDFTTENIYAAIDFLHRQKK